MSKKEKKSQKKKGTPPKPAKRKPSVETATLDDAPTIGEDQALGTLSPDADDESTADAKPSRKKKDATPDDTGAPAQQEAGEPEPLRLPRGGFVAFRKSGGLNFSTREVVVYPDGRVAYDARGVPQKEYTRLRRALNDGQMGALRRTLDQAGFWKEESGGEQNPDAFAYEIAARLGQRSNEIQLYDGSVPERLVPLIDQLTRLLPE